MKLEDASRRAKLFLIRVPEGERVPVGASEGVGAGPGGGRKSARKKGTLPPPEVAPRRRQGTGQWGTLCS